MPDLITRYYRITYCSHGHEDGHSVVSNDYINPAWCPGGSRVLLANGERVEPDYEAAKLAVFDMDEQIAMARSQGQRFSLTEVNDMKVRAAVDAAIGGKLLVDLPTEKDES